MWRMLFDPSSLIDQKIVDLYTKLVELRHLGHEASPSKTFSSFWLLEQAQVGMLCEYWLVPKMVEVKASIQLSLVFRKQKNCLIPSFKLV